MFIKLATAKFFLNKTLKGTYKGNLPTCKPISCGAPPPIYDGLYSTKGSNVYMDQAVYVCYDGFYLSKEGKNYTYTFCSMLA